MRISPELSEVCGIHAGDGYLRMRGSKGELDISGHLEEKEYYDEHVVPLFNKVFNLNLKGRKFSRGTYGFVVYNKKIAEFFNELGFPFGKKSTIVKVPEKILDSKSHVLYARFLRGLFDTDGHLGFKKSYGKYILFKRTRHHYPLINLTTVSKLLARNISFILKEIGIKHFIYSYQPKDLRDNYKYVVIISGKDRLDKWINQISIKNPVKLSRFLVWKKFGFCPTHTTLKQREDILNGKLDIYSIKGP